MNTWIDFCIITENEKDMDRAKEIAKAAYNDWWEAEDTQFEPIADYIGSRLYEKGIEFDIYFKNESEDE
jgi:hypothetical protein